MSKQDKQKLSILVVLIGVLAVTVVLGYRMYNPPITATVQAPVEAKTSERPPAPNDAHILLERVGSAEGEDQDVGKRDLFRYHQAPPPPAPVVARAKAPEPPIVSTPQIPPRPSVTPGPTVITPPPINLKYFGFIRTTTPNAGFTAVVGDDSRHYNVTTGEVLMGRYRILSITEKTVEVEDLEHNRRQMLQVQK
jgi:hypothetical protein